MESTEVTPVLNVADHEMAVSWYTNLFGRQPDRRSSDTSAEWQLADGTSVQVVHDADASGQGGITIAVADVEAHVNDLAQRDVVTDPITQTPQSRLAEVRDPAGNTITFAQPL
jgi:predicted enzyme related to lactoylglutathione lyase